MKNFKKQMKLCMSAAMLCLLALVFVPEIQCQAAAKAPTCQKNKTMYVKEATSWMGTPTIVWDGYGGNDDCNIPIKNLASNAKITNIKVSNPKVLKAKYDKRITKKGLAVSFQKFGTATVSFQVKQNGKTYKLSCKYTFKKTPTPFKSFKINGKELRTKFVGKNSVDYKTGKSSFKLSYRPDASTKDMKITVTNVVNGQYGKEKQVKNNATIKIPKNGSVYVCITYGYKKYSKAQGVRTITVYR